MVLLGGPSLPYGLFDRKPALLMLCVYSCRWVNLGGGVTAVEARVRFLEAGLDCEETKNLTPPPACPLAGPVFISSD